MFNSSFGTAQETNSISVTKTNQLMLYREITAVHSNSQTKQINALCGQNVEFLNFKHGLKLGFEQFNIHQSSAVLHFVHPTAKIQTKAHYSSA